MIGYSSGSLCSSHSPLCSLMRDMRVPVSRARKSAFTSEASDTLMVVLNRIVSLCSYLCVFEL